MDIDENSPVQKALGEMEARNPSISRILRLSEIMPGVPAIKADRVGVDLETNQPVYDLRYDGFLDGLRGLVGEARAEVAEGGAEVEVALGRCTAMHIGYRHWDGETVVSAGVTVDF